VSIYNLNISFTEWFASFSFGRTGYGWTWLIKSAAFPDRAWERSATVVDIVAFWITMSIFALPVVLVARGHAEVPAPVLGAFLLMWSIGNFIVYVSDSKPSVSMQTRVTVQKATVRHKHTCPTSPRWQKQKTRPPAHCMQCTEVDTTRALFEGELNKHANGTQGVLIHGT
jgi:hypothetical protein